MCFIFLAKYILFFSNLAFLLAGLTLMGLGIAVSVQLNVLLEVINASFLEIIPALVIALGATIFLIAFFGCCGAIKESVCMLVTYSVIMLLLLLTKLTLTIQIFVMMDTALDALVRWINAAFIRQPTAFQAVEMMFSCCGPEGATSYDSPNLPDSCCATAPCGPTNAYTGCTGVVQDFVNTFGLAIAGVITVVLAVEFVAMVFGLCLATNVRNKTRRGRVV